MTGILSTLLILALGPASAVQTRGAASVPAATGTISGLVTSDDEGKVPVRRAVITVRGEQSGERITTTDEGGRFLLDDLAADRYSVTASKPAYVVAAFGARKSGGSSPLVLA